MEEKKIIEYVVKIRKVLTELLSGEREDNLKINVDELFVDNNFGCFIHALSLAGAALCSAITDQTVNCLKYNHLCNRLIFQYAKRKPSRHESDEKPECDE